MQQEVDWQGYFVYGNGYFTMKFQKAEIQVDPPGTIQCSGSDHYGSFTMSGSFYKNFCIIKKQYQSNDHFFRYIGEVFYPPQSKMNPLQQDSQQKLQYFNSQVEQVHRDALALLRQYSQKHYPVKRVMIRGIYFFPQGRYGSVFGLTLVPKGSLKQQQANQVGGQKNIKQLEQEWMLRAHKIGQKASIDKVRKQ